MTEGNTYKHTISAKLFLEALLATDEQQKYKSSFFSESGITIVKGSVLNEKYNNPLGMFLHSDEKYTVIRDADIHLDAGEDISLNEINNEFYPCPIIFIRCNVPSISITNCIIASFNKDGRKIKGLDLTFVECVIDKISVENSTMGSINLYQSSIYGIGVSDSIISDIELWRTSKASMIYVEDTEMKMLAINFDCKVIELGIETSITNSIHVSESEIDEFAISHCNCNWIDIKRSSIDDFSIIYTTADRIRIWDNCAFKEIEVGYITTPLISISDSKAIEIYFEVIISDKFSIWNSEFKEITVSTLSGNDFIIGESSIGITTMEGLFTALSFEKIISPEIQLKYSRISKFKIATGCETILSICNDTVIDFFEIKQSNLSSKALISLIDVSIYACIIEELSSLGYIYFRQLNASQTPFDWYNIDDFIQINEFEWIDNVDKGKEYSRILTKIRNTFIDKSKGTLQKQKIYYAELITKEQNSKKIFHSTFRIVQSSLGKSEFTDCDLGAFKSFEFNSSRILESFFTGGTVPEESIEIYNVKPNSNKWHEQKISIYNQLSRIFESQGNVYLSTHFRSKTAEHQKELIRLNRKTFWSDATLEVFTFQLNSLSNKHGASWGRAIFFILSTSLAFYLLYLLSVGRVFQTDYSFDSRLIGYYFTFINPFRPFEFLKEVGVEMNTFTRIIDFFSRIIISYGIYQFIAAFRRYGKH